MEKRETSSKLKSKPYDPTFGGTLVVKYVDIKETRCGKCKNLKIVDLTEVLCLIHGVNPRIVPDFFGEACEEFEEL